RRARQTGQQRGFVERELCRVLAEILTRRGLDTVGAASEIDLVEIQLENPALRILVLDHPRDPCFFELARDRAPACRQAIGEDVARELHRDRARALLDAQCTNVVVGSAANATPIDAVMSPEPLVLHRDERARYVAGQGIDRNRDVLHWWDASQLVP